jgi:hypothetical protein
MFVCFNIQHMPNTLLPEKRTGGDDTRNISLQ